MTSALLAVALLAGAPAEPSAVYGEGQLEGQLRISCAQAGFGRASGTAFLSGWVKARDAEGRTGDVHVSGSGFVEGQCRAGRVQASVSVTVRGQGRLKGADGEPRDVWVAGDRRLELFDAGEGRIDVRVHASVRGR